MALGIAKFKFKERALVLACTWLLTYWVQSRPSRESTPLDCFWSPYERDSHPMGGDQELV